MKLTTARKKNLTLCFCFWLFTLTLVSLFRFEEHRILSLIQTESSEQILARPDIAQAKPKKQASNNSARLSRDWQDWQRKPAKWDQKQKEEFFKANCKDIIESGQEKLRKISRNQNKN